MKKSHSLLICAFTVLFSTTAIGQLNKIESISKLKQLGYVLDRELEHEISELDWIYPHHGLYSWSGECVVDGDHPDAKCKYVCEICHTLAINISTSYDYKLMLKVEDVVHVNLDKQEVDKINELNQSKIRNPNCAIKYYLPGYNHSKMFSTSEMEKEIGFVMSGLQNLGFTVVLDFFNSYSFEPLSDQAYSFAIRAMDLRLKNDYKKSRSRMGLNYIIDNLQPEFREQPKNSIVYTIPRERKIWWDLAKWGIETGELEPRERSMCAIMGKLFERNGTPSAAQENFAKEIWNKALRNGFEHNLDIQSESSNEKP